MESNTLPFTVITFLAALALTTAWHELGHLLVACRLRVPVKVIGVGLGPALWRTNVRNDVRLEVRAVPVGMAIGVLGRRTADGQPRRPVGHDLAVAAGGPAASFLLAVLLIGLAYLVRFDAGLQTWLVASGILSAVLTLLNLIPLPGLDGGHLVLLALARFGLQLAPQQEVRLHRAGMRVLTVVCILGLLATYGGRVVAGV